MSKNTRNTLIVIVIVVIGLIIWFATQGTPTPTNSPTNTNTNTTPTGNNNNVLTPTTGTSVNTPVATTPVPTKSFTIVANDTGSSISVINVKKGEVVSLTFNVGAQTPNHGGLSFSSDVVNTGTISPLSSKTVIFTATESFTITPYWPDTNTRKSYTISVNVE